jgi:hypothetical protein
MPFHEVPRRRGDLVAVLLALTLVGAATGSGCGAPAEGVEAVATAGPGPAEPVTGAVPFTVRFAPPAIWGNGAARPTHTWDFGDGSPPVAEVSPVHTYCQEGLYAAMLTVAGDQGLVLLTRVVIVDVQPPATPDAAE